jgi:phage-related protein
MSESYSVVAKLKAIDDGFSKVFGNAQSTVTNFNNKTSAAMGAVIGVIGVAAKAAGVAAGAFGVFGVGAAAGAQAMEAQFSQTFGDLEGEAQSSVEALGDQFGMLPNRIKPAFTQMSAKFKGLGMDTASAMEQASKATTIAADASASFDTSMESAQGSLNSFVNGNYEGGEAIGLFANETQMAAYASETLGQDWNALDEAGKQVVRLDYAATMQANSGATGQAARESESLQNQLGNVKQGFKDAAAAVMTPMLEPLTGVLAGITEKLVEVIPKIQEFMDKIANSTIVQTFGDAIQLLKDKFAASEGLQTFVNMLQTLGEKILAIDLTAVIESVSAFMETWGPIIVQVAGFVLAFAAVVKIFAMVQTAITLVTGVMAFLAAPIGFVALAIAGLVALGITLYQNWDAIKAAASSLGEWLSSTWDNIKAWTAAAWDAVWTAITTAVTNAYNSVVQWFTSMGASVQEKVASIKEKVSTGFTEAWNTIVEKVTSMKAAITTGFSDMVSAVQEKGSEIVDKVKTAFQNAVDGAKEFASDAISAGKDLIAGFVQGIKDKASALVDSVKGAVGDAISAAKNLLGIGSPSRVFKQFGRWTDEGLAIGIDQGAKGPLKAVQNMAGAVAGAWNPNLFDVASNVRGINANVGQKIDHVVSDNLSGNKPAYVTFNLGGRSYSAFVDDISGRQNQVVKLEETYLGG